MSFLPKRTVGTFFQRPPSAPEGTPYTCTDSPISFVMKNGAWQPFLGSTPLKTPPALSTWGQINAATTSASDYRGGLLLDANITQLGAGKADLRLLKQTAPAPPYQITVHLIPTWTGGINNPTNFNFCSAGIVWRQSSNGSIEVFGPILATTGSIYTIYWRPHTADSTTATTTVYTSGSDNITLLDWRHFAPSGGHGIWLRGIDDGTNRTVWISADGQDFSRLGSETRTTNITPDEVGIYIGNGGGSGSNAVRPMTFFTSVLIESLAPPAVPGAYNAWDTVNVASPPMRAAVPQQALILGARGGNVVR